MTLVRVVGAGTSGYKPGACATCGTRWRPGDPIAVAEVAVQVNMFRRLCPACFGNDPNGNTTTPRRRR